MTHRHLIGLGLIALAFVFAGNGPGGLILAFVLFFSAVGVMTKD